MDSPLLIGLHDAEKEHMKKKTFPNLALMKISAYHKAKGDKVVWWEPMVKCDKVYSSKVFDYTEENLYLPPDTIRGGTGYSDIPLSAKLPPEIEECFPDYTIYPACDYAIGYITRGCPRDCEWCVVPQKEGNISFERTWGEIVRPDTKKLTLLDNNILANRYGIRQLEELAKTDYQVDLNQGMDARLVTPEVARILAQITWQRYIRFSCDQTSQIDDILRVAYELNRHGVKPYRLFIYLLVKEDVEEAAYRVEKLKHLKGIRLYAQPERNEALGIVPTMEQKVFAGRYVYKGIYRTESWEGYKSRHSLEQRKAT